MAKTDKVDLASSMTCEQIQNIWATEPEVMGLLDLRSPEEFLKRHIPGAQNVSLDNLRDAVLLLEDKLAVIVCDESQERAVDEILKGRTNYVFMRGCEKWFLDMENRDREQCKKGQTDICIWMNEDVPETHIEEVLNNLGKIRLIDVRRQDEFNGELGHIAGAELITLGDELTQSLLREKNHEQQIIFICRSGKRSETATREALRLGFKNVINMAGGMLLWNEKKYPVAKV